MKLKTVSHFPLPAIANLFGAERVIQVNHCRMPLCKNYGVPARHQKSKTGPSADRDPAYRVHSTKQGQVQTILCKACNENPPIKSNASIVSEINRLIDFGGLLSAAEEVSASIRAATIMSCLPRPLRNSIDTATRFEFRHCAVSLQGCQCIPYLALNVDE